MGEPTKSIKINTLKKLGEKSGFASTSTSAMHGKILCANFEMSEAFVGLVENMYRM